jgi:hypothetical protein
LHEGSGRHSPVSGVMRQLRPFRVCGKEKSRGAAADRR